MQAVRWLTECGNGIVEGEEQCDDGNLAGGDGCSAVCKVPIPRQALLEEAPGSSAIVAELCTLASHECWPETLPIVPLPTCSVSVMLHEGFMNTGKWPLADEDLFWHTSRCLIPICTQAVHNPGQHMKRQQN